MENTIDTSLITGTVPPASVFQTERYGEFTYTIPNLTAGSAQTVTLYFEKSYWTVAGQRTFDVSNNGTIVLSAFDIFAAAGGVNRAIARTFSTTADSSGQVAIQFTLNGPDQPKVCGITITSWGSSSTSYTLTIAPSSNGSTNPAAGSGWSDQLQSALSDWEGGQRSAVPSVSSGSSRWLTSSRVA